MIKRGLKIMSEQINSPLNDKNEIKSEAISLHHINYKIEIKYYAISLNIFNYVGKINLRVI